MIEWQSHYKSLSSNPTLIFRHSDLILPKELTQTCSQVSIIHDLFDVRIREP